MNCDRCGSPVPIGAATCPRCGTTMRVSTLQAYVPPYAAPMPPTRYNSIPPQPYDPYNPYEPTALPPPPPLPESQPRRPHTPLIITIIIMVVLVAITGAGVAIVLSRFTASITATPTPTPVTYPALAATYTGTADNTTVNTDANITLEQIKQNKGTFSGVLQVQLPLCGSGPFTGTITPKGVIQLAATSTDACKGTVTFKGSLQPDGSMSGTYTTSSNENGIFLVKPL